MIKKQFFAFNKFLILGATITLTSFNAFSADGDNKSPWAISTEFGYINVSGNSNTESIKGVLDVSNDTKTWLHKSHAEAFSASNTTTDTTVIPSVTTKERTSAKWLITGQSDYKFSEFQYIYFLASYDDDRFSGFDYNAKLGAGYGNRFVLADKHELKAEVGPGYRSFKVDQVAPTSSQDEFLLRLFAGYAWDISDTSKLTSDLTLDSGEDQTEWKSYTAVSASINNSLAMKFSHTVKFLDIVPVGNKQYDRETGVTLVYTF